VFLFLDMFDTVGTLIGVSERAGLLRDGKLPRARWALFSDSVGTVAGACMGTSTITSYVESAAGVQAGARTGLSNLTTALLFLLAILAYPFLGVISSPHFVDLVALPRYKASLYPVIAPALVLIGAMMLQEMKRIEWDDPTEFIPAFLTLIIMPLTVNITEGIAFGFISYSILKLVTGRLRDSHWGIHALSVVLLLRYVFLSA
jgi:AGZA family xanthine/uracil permease-like MFS transporter